MRSVKVVGKPYYGAPCPPFNKFRINESEFEFGERGKEWEISINDNEKTVKIDWLTQEQEYPSDLFIAEIKRALRMNNVTKEYIVELNYGVRDDGLSNRIKIDMA